MTTLLLTLLLAIALISTGHAQSILSCSNSYHLLEQNLLSNTENRYQLSRTFYPPRDPRPVVVKIHYTYSNASNETVTWFWTESQFYLIQPLEIFQYTSLFFSNLPHRQREVTIVLSEECMGTGDEYMEVLTQRMKLYASTPSTSPDASPQRITDSYIAIAASLEEIKSDSLQSNFLKIWLHVFLVLFPVATLLCLLLCDPVQLLLGDKVWTKLEDESTHATIAALIQVSVLFTALVFVFDIMALFMTVLGDFLAYDTHSAFYLSTVTGMLVDMIAFVWVMFVLIRSCHWDCKNFWYKWKNRQPCNRGESEKIKKLMSTIIVAPVLCFANHIHYILLALIADPFHAGGIIITYLVSFGLHYFLFRQFYNLVVFRSFHREHANERKVYAIRSQSRENVSTSTAALGRQQSISQITPKKDKCKRIPFNTQTVVFGLLILAPFILLYEGIIIALFVSLPISKTIEDAPSRLYSIYQGTGILIVSLLTYNILLAPSGFSISKAIDYVAKQVQLPEQISSWNMLSDEEKSANLITTLLREGRLQQLVEVEQNDSASEESLDSKTNDSAGLTNRRPRGYSKDSMWSSNGGSETGVATVTPETSV